MRTIKELEKKFNKVIDSKKIGLKKLDNGKVEINVWGYLKSDESKVIKYKNPKSTIESLMFKDFLKIYKPINLPNKVVYNKKIGRTTLIFDGFKVARSQVDDIDEFSEKIGFLVAMIKYLYPSNYKKHIDLGYSRYNKYKNNLVNYFEMLVRPKLTRLSQYQVSKLFDNIAKKDKLLFSIVDEIQHEIVVERKDLLDKDVPYDLSDEPF